MTLTLNILRHHFIRDISTAAAKIPSRPDMPTPKLLLQMRKLLQQLVRRLPFQPLYQPADRYLRRYRYKNMHVIFRNVPLHDRYLFIPTNLSDQFTYPSRHFPGQGWPSVLRHPHQVQVYFEYAVRPSPILFHTPYLPQPYQCMLKPSPKGEGFNPPRLGQ